MCDSSSSSLARPKSAIFSVPSAASSTFEGFRSAMDHAPDVGVFDRLGDRLRCLGAPPLGLRATV